MQEENHHIRLVYPKQKNITLFHGVEELPKFFSLMETREKSQFRIELTRIVNEITPYIPEIDERNTNHYLIVNIANLGKVEQIKTNFQAALNTLLNKINSPSYVWVKSENETLHFYDDIALRNVCNLIILWCRKESKFSEFLFKNKNYNVFYHELKALLESAARQEILGSFETSAILLELYESGIAPLNQLFDIEQLSNNRKTEIENLTMQTLILQSDKEEATLLNKNLNEKINSLTQKNEGLEKQSGLKDTEIAQLKKEKNNYGRIGQALQKETKQKDEKIRELQEEIKQKDEIIRALKEKCQELEKEKGELLQENEDSLSVIVKVAEKRRETLRGKRGNPNNMDNESVRNNNQEYSQ